MKEGLTLTILGITYVVGGWVYTQNEYCPIHCVKGNPHLACEFHEDGSIEIRNIYAFDISLIDAFAAMSDWDYVEPNPMTEREIDTIEDAKL